MDDLTGLSDGFIRDYMSDGYSTNFDWQITQILREREYQKKHPSSNEESKNVHLGSSPDPQPFYSVTDKSDNALKHEARKRGEYATEFVPMPNRPRKKR